MAARAKFTVGSITRTQGTVWKDSKPEPQEVQTVELYPVTGGNDENKSFFASTPSGIIKLGMVNLDAARVFELNKSYYVDFTPAE